MTCDFPDGTHDLPPGKLAAVVTWLEMTDRPAPRDIRAPEGVELVAHPAPAPDWYRALYRRVGEDWLWVSRLSMGDAALATILHAPEVEVYSLRKGGEDLGLLELDFRDPDNTELAFFGLAPELIGTGAGRWLMEQALARVFARPVRRFFVHTCTLDSPQALAFYIRSGFTPFKRSVEIMDDPRRAGAIAPHIAPHIPLL
ncbi:GNAT family N-acetyltransferase [Celeribacter indicus]|nr:GNAT family N-acetyltransferase [Celeribacter indicus]SDW56515.1 Acetyltransferase (GNAT) family protein [Celeribacter indicus]